VSKGVRTRAKQKSWNPRLRTSFEILARANVTPTEELDRAWEEVQLSVAKGGSNIGGHDACFVAVFLAVWP